MFIFLFVHHYYSFAQVFLISACFIQFLSYANGSTYSLIYDGLLSPDLSKPYLFDESHQNHTRTSDDNNHHPNKGRMFPCKLSENLTSQMIGTVLKLYYESFHRMSNIIQGGEGNMRFGNAERAIEQRCYTTPSFEKWNKCVCSADHTNQDGGITLHLSSSFFWTSTSCNSVDEKQEDQVQPDEKIEYLAAVRTEVTITTNFYSTPIFPSSLEQHLSRDILVQSIPRIHSLLQSKDIPMNCILSQEIPFWSITPRHSFTSFNIPTSSMHSSPFFYLTTSSFSSLDGLLRDSIIPKRMRIDNPKKNADIIYKDGDDPQIWVCHQYQPEDGAQPLDTSMNFSRKKMIHLFYLNSILRATNTPATSIQSEAFVHPAYLSHPQPQTIALLSNFPMSHLREIFKHKPANNKEGQVTVVGFDSNIYELVQKHFPQIDWCHSDPKAVHSCISDERVTLIDPKETGMKEWIYLVSSSNLHTSIDNTAICQSDSIQQNIHDSVKLDILFFDIQLAQSKQDSIPLETFLDLDFYTRVISLLKDQDSLFVLSVPSFGISHLSEEGFRNTIKGFTKSITINYFCTSPEVVMYEEPFAAPMNNVFIVIFPGGNQSKSYQRFARDNIQEINHDLLRRFLYHDISTKTHYTGERHVKQYLPSHSY